MKGGAGGRSGEDSSNQTADNRSGNAENRGHDESKVLDTWEDRTRAQADNETDNDRPNDV